MTPTSTLSENSEDLIFDFLSIFRSKTQTDLKHDFYGFFLSIVKISLYCTFKLNRFIRYIRVAFNLFRNFSFSG